MRKLQLEQIKRDQNWVLYPGIVIYIKNRHFRHNRVIISILLDLLLYPGGVEIAYG